MTNVDRESDRPTPVGSCVTLPSDVVSTLVAASSGESGHAYTDKCPDMHDETTRDPENCLLCKAMLAAERDLRDVQEERDG